MPADSTRFISENNQANGILKENPRNNWFFSTELVISTDFEQKERFQPAFSGESLHMLARIYRKPSVFIRISCSSLEKPFYFAQVVKHCSLEQEQSSFDQLKLQELFICLKGAAPIHIRSEIVFQVCELVFTQ